MLILIQSMYFLIKTQEVADNIDLKRNILALFINLNSETIKVFLQPGLNKTKIKVKSDILILF